MSSIGFRAAIVKSPGQRTGPGAMKQSAECLMKQDFTESVVEQAALAWLKSMGYQVLSGTPMAGRCA